MAREVHLRSPQRRRGKDLMAMIPILTDHAFDLGRTSTETGLRLARIGSMGDVQRKFSGAIRMVSCAYNSMTTYWRLDHMIRQSRYGILTLGRRSGPCVVIHPASEHYSLTT